ncbi:hypothetical protein [Streptomyces sp. NPDC047028]|uniref:hypothetical protein n=1 Tax=Streptomyces sp. NPDC047028 TaxID=3155793 RepID=UPI0033F7B53A
MTFPQTPLDVRVELSLSGVWTDVTDDVYVSEKISISRGRADEAARTDPGKCTLTFNNGDSNIVAGISGRYSPRNPLSDLYGLIGRNTPLRVSVPGPTTYLEVDGNPANTASTPDAAALDITGDLDIRWEGEADWNAAGAQILIGKWGDAGQRSYHLRLQNGDLYLHTTQDGTSGHSWFATLPALPPHAALRATVDVDNGASGATARMYWAPTLDGPWEQIASDIVSSGTLTIFASTAPLTIAPEQLDLVDPQRLPVTGRVYKAEVRNGIDGTVVAAPDFTAQAAGTESFTDSAGLDWTVNGDAVVSNRRTRFVGEVSSWPARWDVSGKDVRVPVEAAGILRRYGQGAKSLDSALTRRVPSFNPVAYWPMEEGANAVQCYSPIDGVAPLTLSGFDMASNDTLAGSKPLPVIREGATLSGTVPMPAGSPTEWHTEFLFRMDTAPSTTQTLLQWVGTGTVKTWTIEVTSSGANLHGYDADGTAVVTSLGAFSALYGKWYRWKIYATQNGSSVDWVENWTAVGESASQFSGSYTGTLGRISKVMGPPGYSSELAGASIGHIGVFTEANTVAYNLGDIGFAGETAAERMIRLGSEEHKPVTVYADVSEDELVGAQRPETYLDLIEEAADVDGGILYERRDVLGLVYRDRATLYSQVPALLLDYTTRGHVAPPLEPVDDDQKVRNDVTVTRDGGSSARVTLDSGALSTQAPPDGVGVYDEQVTLNLYDDDQTEPQAAWRLHLGTVDEARYPVVNINLAAGPSLIDQVTDLDSGDRIQIANPPAWLPPGPIDLIVQGYGEVIGHPNDWDVQLNCTPASPWTVAEVAISEDFEDSTLTVTASDGGDLPWGRTQTHFNTGSWSLQSGAITNNQTSDWVLTVPTGATELTFWYRTSSEAAGAGFEGDRLLVLVDDTQVLRAQGETAWTSTTIDVTGAAAVTFQYAKDNSGGDGEDAVWIDDLTFNRSPMRADTDGSELAADATATATSLSVATTAGPVWVDSTTYPAEFPFDITVGGERMRVTGISGTTTPQTFTVVRSLNGVVKAQTDGTDVRLTDPAIAAL